MNRKHFNNGNWVMKVIMTLVTCHLSLVTSNAQSFTDRVQQAAPAGRVTIHQDVAISNLVNGVTPAPVAPRRNDRQTDRRHNASEHSASGRNDRQTATTTPTNTATTSTASPATDSVAAAQPRRMHKVAGYRVQAFVGGKTRADKQKAEQTGNRLKTLFPGHRVHVHFLGGRWTCRLGDFRSKTEAREVLDEVVRLGYDTAILVRGKVDVPY